MPWSAAAALDRLGWADRIAERLDVDVMLPQVGQAALAVECRADDDEVRSALERIEHGPTRRAVDAERGFLAELGGDCSLPAGAHATWPATACGSGAWWPRSTAPRVVRHESPAPPRPRGAGPFGGPPPPRRAGRGQAAGRGD